MARTSSAQFVGRAAELAELERAWADAVAGHGRVAVVLGEAGIGKSRLVAELAARIRTTGAVVALGRCLDIEAGVLPLGPILEILRALPQGRQAMPAAARRRAPASGALDDAERRVTQGRFFADVASRVTDAAATHPLCLVVEDVQWIDPGSRGVVRYLGHALSSKPVLLVLTARTDAPAEARVDRDLLVELARESGTIRLDLGPLAESEVEALLHELGVADRGGGGASIGRRANGNPFYVEELAVMARAGAGGLSPTLRDLLLARLAVLPQDVGSVVAAAALAEGPIRNDELAAVTGRTPAELRAALRAAIAASVFIPVADQPSRADVRFRHDLVREAAEADLLASERRDLHRAWADALERLDGPTEHSRVAWHRDGGGQPAAALLAHLRAADQSTSMLAPVAALDHLQRAIQLWDTPGAAAAADRTLAIALSEAAEAAYLADRPTDAATLAGRALALPDGLSGDDRLRVEELLVGYVWSAGDEVAAFGLQDRLLEDDRLPEDPRRRAVSIAFRARAHFVASRIRAVPAPGTRGRRTGRQRGAPVGREPRPEHPGGRPGLPGPVRRRRRRAPPRVRGRPRGAPHR